MFSLKETCGILVLKIKTLIVVTYTQIVPSSIRNNNTDIP